MDNSSEGLSVVSSESSKVYPSTSFILVLLSLESLEIKMAVQKPEVELEEPFEEVAFNFLKASVFRVTKDG